MLPLCRRLLLKCLLFLMLRSIVVLRECLQSIIHELRRLIAALTTAGIVRGSSRSHQHQLLVACGLAKAAHQRLLKRLVDDGCLLLFLLLIVKF
jgi:hypothetical protein